MTFDENLKSEDRIQNTRFRTYTSVNHRQHPRPASVVIDSLLLDVFRV